MKRETLQMLGDAWMTSHARPSGPAPGQVFDAAAVTEWDSHHGTGLIGAEGDPIDTRKGSGAAELMGKGGRPPLTGCQLG